MARIERLLVLAIIGLGCAAAGKISITTVAAGTTIAINVLDIKSTVAKARAAAKATKRAATKAAKKVAGK